MRFRFVPGLLLLLAIPAASQATVGPPIKMQLAGAPRAAVAGQLYTGTLVVSSRVATDVSSLQLETMAWRDLVIRTPLPARIDARGSMHIDFEAVAADADAPLVFRAQVGGRALRQSF